MVRSQEIKPLATSGGTGATPAEGPANVVMRGRHFPTNPVVLEMV